MGGQGTFAIGIKQTFCFQSVAQLAVAESTQSFTRRKRLPNDQLIVSSLWMQVNATKNDELFTRGRFCHQFGKLAAPDHAANCRLSIRVLQGEKQTAAIATSARHFTRHPDLLKLVV